MRAFLVNSGILGHRSVAGLVSSALATCGDIATTEINLSEALTLRERAARRLVCWGPGRATSLAAGLTVARWRREWHAGLLARHRIASAARDQGSPEVLHFHTQATAFASLGRMRRVPSVVSIDITQDLASREVPPGIRRWQYAACGARDAQIFRAARAIISTSHWAARDVARSVPECGDRIRVMPYPVLLDGFDPAWMASRRQRTGTKSPIRVLFIGGDFLRKGGPDLFDAWRTAALGDAAELRVMTDWPIDPRSVPPHTTVIRDVRAYSPEWFVEWKDADLFVMPTTGEAFGMVFQEAAAAGLASIGSDINAVPEIVVDGETGILTPVHDPHALSAALCHLVSDPEARHRLGAAARRRAERLYAPATYGARLADVFRTIALVPSATP